MTPIRTALLGLALSASFAGAALADAPCPPGVPAQVACGGKTLGDFTTGSYKVDPQHAAVIARVPHIGYSYSIFRFNDVKGQLAWNLEDPSKSKLNVQVATGSIDTNVPDFATQLSGEGFLNAKAFPQATFVSTAFRKIDDTHGKVDGQFTLLGKTAPVTFDVELVGAGKGFGMGPRLGVHATTSITPKDFGMMPMFDKPIDLVIDVEFEKAS
jgi:polyisoprenoid-binding protein YceI